MESIEPRSNMSEEELKYPAWQGALLDVLLECDVRKLAEKIASVESLLCGRVQQLHQDGSDQSEELQALSDGLSSLRALKRLKPD